MPRKPDPKVRTIQDCPEAIALVRKLNRYKTPRLGWRTSELIPGFSMGRANDYLHFSLRTGYEKKLGLPTRDHFSDEKVWAQWIPRRSEVLRLVTALTCPKEDLPPIALQEPDYTVINLKFIGYTKVMNCKTVAREIALARMEGKL